MSKYKAGDKFIVEIVETICGYGNNPDDKGLLSEPLHRIRGFNTLVFDDYGLDKLQKYDDSEYAEGVKEGLNSFDCEVKKAYEKGLQDAWKLALKVSAIPKKDGIPHDDCKEMFGTICGAEIIRNNTPQEALAKIEAYEKSQQIQVGDVVVSKRDERQKFVVTYIFEDRGKVAGTRYDGAQIEYDIDAVKETGRHIDINSIFEQIRGMSSEKD